MKFWHETSDTYDVVHIMHNGRRTEFRGSAGYGSAQPDGDDRLAALLDSLSGPTVSALLAGDVVHLPKPGRCAADFTMALLALRWATADENVEIEWQRALGCTWARR